MENPATSDIIFYASPQGNTRIEVIYEGETFWLSQKRMAELFGVDVRTVNEHLKNIYETQELDREATIRNFRIVQFEGNREVAREVACANLDAIIAVGYRVNSFQATQFRIWATKTLVSPHTRQPICERFRTGNEAAAGQINAPPDSQFPRSLHLS